MDKEKYILLTIDVEDWFQVENFRPWIPFETWDQRELRVEKNTHRLLDLLDSIKLQPPNLPASRLQADDYQLSAIPIHRSLKGDGGGYESKNNGQRTTDNGQTKKVRATFFVLGWLAERLPNLVRKINARGHEIASHGYNHNLCNQLSHSELRNELTDSKKLLEDITGSAVLGFRAPNFSISDNILKIIEDCGYHYDSSYNSFSLHGRYGKISLNGNIKQGIAHKVSENFFELPISNLNISSRIPVKGAEHSNRNRFILPWGGGAYFRLIPFSLFKRGIKNIISRDNAYLFYAHPWEIDSDQPVVRVASAVSKLKHYLNISKSRKKLLKLIYFFPECQFPTCSQYLDQNK